MEKELEKHLPVVLFQKLQNGGGNPFETVFDTAHANSRENLPRRWQAVVDEAEREAARRFLAAHRQQLGEGRLLARELGALGEVLTWTGRYALAPKWLTENARRRLAALGEAAPNLEVLTQQQVKDRSRELAECLLGQFHLWRKRKLNQNQVQAIEDLLKRTPPTLRGNWRIGLTNQTSHLLKDFIIPAAEIPPEAGQNDAAANLPLLNSPDRRWLGVQELPPTLQRMPSVVSGCLQPKNLNVEVSTEGACLPISEADVEAGTRQDALFQTMLWACASGSLLGCRGKINLRWTQTGQPVAELKDAPFAVLDGRLLTSCTTVHLEDRQINEVLALYSRKARDNPEFRHRWQQRNVDHAQLYADFRKDILSTLLKTEVKDLGYREHHVIRELLQNAESAYASKPGALPADRDFEFVLRPSTDGLMWEGIASHSGRHFNEPVRLPDGIQQPRDDIRLIVSTPGAEAAPTEGWIGRFNRGFKSIFTVAETVRIQSGPYEFAIHDLLLLSGTPHQGDDERFLRLLHLARPDLFQPDERAVEAQLTREALTETLTRTPKSRAVDWDGRKLFQGHDTTTIEVPWTSAELEVSRLLTQYILKSLDNVRGGDRSFALVVELVMHTFHKIAASSWRALEAALTRRAEGLQSRQQTLANVLALEDDEEDERRAFTKPLQQFFADEQTLLDTLLARIRALVRDSKWERCAELLRQIEAHEPGAKVLLFTQYRATQDYLCERLADLFTGTRVEVIHGDTPPEERREARRRFERDSRFLVSTEAGGEGINLQKACHLMVNYDLPWNPMRLQQRIGRLDRYGQTRRVRVFNLRVPESWDARISQRIFERLAVIQRTLNLAGLNEDYRDMLLGEVAEQMEPTRLFSRAMRGEEVPDATVDDWIREAARSVDRLRQWLGDTGGFSGDPGPLRPTLTAEDFQRAFELALGRHGLRLQATRNSANQFVPGVYHFRLPEAFRDPVFRPERTCHVVFDRAVFLQVRDEDLGRVRGQPIKPVLAGFGEPVTDWLFQSAFEARPNESAFALRAGEGWPHGEGWLLVYALRWLGPARRLAAPDSLAAVFATESGHAMVVPPPDCLRLAPAAETSDSRRQADIPAGVKAATLDVARGVLRERIARRNSNSVAGVGLSLLLAAAIHVSP